MPETQCEKSSKYEKKEKYSQNKNISLRSDLTKKLTKFLMKIIFPFAFLKDKCSNSYN